MSCIVPAMGEMLSRKLASVALTAAIAIGVGEWSARGADEVAPAEPERFTVAPEPDGFIRLDTRSGAIAQCRKVDGNWTCTPAIEDRKSTRLNSSHT